MIILNQYGKKSMATQYNDTDFRLDSNLDECLDHMVDNLLAYQEIAFLDRLQMIWRRDWPLLKANPPTDTDQLRLALKACIIERMVEVFNAPPKNDIQQSPNWCKTIGPSPQAFSVIPKAYQYIWENQQGSAIFAKRNIFAPKQFMFFL